MIFISILFVVMGMSGNKISRIEGVILWVFFIIYLVYLFILAKNGKEENEKVKVITEHALYSFCLGLYWAANMNKSRANDGETN